MQFLVILTQTALNYHYLKSRNINRQMTKSKYIFTYKSISIDTQIKLIFFINQSNMHIRVITKLANS